MKKHSNILELNMKMSTQKKHIKPLGNISWILIETISKLKTSGGWIKSISIKVISLEDKSC